MRRFLLVISLITVLSACSVSDEQVASAVQLPADIEQQQLLVMQQQKQDFLLLDVRSKEEFEQGHIPGAVNIEHDQLNENIATLMPYTDKPIVVYCRSGRRAGKAIDKLTELGFNQLHHLEGDMQGWQQAKLQISN